MPKQFSRLQSIRGKNAAGSRPYLEVELSKRGHRPGGGERLDTSNPTSKLMLTILPGVATWEREIMLERQRAAARRRHERLKRAIRLRRLPQPPILLARADEVIE